MTLNKIRNCIVHSEGDIKASRNSHIGNIITNNASLSLRNERYIKIDRKYVDFSINKVEEFLDKLYQQVLSS